MAQRRFRLSGRARREHPVSAAAESRVVVVGTGQAAFQLAASLREAGHAGPVTLIGDEPGLPYQRPPLSKTYLHESEDAVLLRGENFYISKNIVVRESTRAVRVCRDVARVVLSNGGTLAYDHLVLATGTHARTLPIPGADLDNVLSLRTLADARALRDKLCVRSNVVIIGGGFVGMEIAAHAASDGHDVTVIEGLDRPMARAVSPAISEHVTTQHRHHGVTVLLNTAVDSLAGTDGQVDRVVLANGKSSMPTSSLSQSALSLIPNSPPKLAWTSARSQAESSSTAIYRRPTAPSVPSATARHSPASTPTYPSGWSRCRTR